MDDSSKSRGSGGGQKVYENFEPEVHVTRNEKSHIVHINLPGFKKEQLRVQLIGSGVLKVSGECPLDGGKRWHRFQRTFQVPEECIANETKAKFEDEFLHLIMPKLATSTQKVPPSPPSKDKAAEKEEKGEEQIIAGSADVAAVEPEVPAKPAPLWHRFAGSLKRSGSGMAGGPGKLRQGRLLKVTAAVLIMSSLGLFAVQKLRGSSVKFDETALCCWVLEHMQRLGCGGHGYSSLWPYWRCLSRRELMTSGVVVGVVVAGLVLLGLGAHAASRYRRSHA